MAKLVGVALLIVAAVAMGFLFGAPFVAVLKIFGFVAGMAFLIIYGIGLVVTGDFRCLHSMFWD